MNLSKFICIILALSLLLFSAVSCGEEGGQPTPPTPDSVESGNDEKDEWDDFCILRDTRDVSEHETVTVKISVRDYGDVILLLDATTAPKTVENFVSLVREGFYDGLTFHRVISNFMIQGGCPNGDGTGNSGKTVEGEFSKNGHENDINHVRGVISMARGEYDKNSASCQFFICNATASHLDGSYAAFGYVISGLSVVDKITADTARYGDQNGKIAYKALQVVIDSITVIE